MAGYDDVWTYAGAIANFDMLSYAGICADGDAQAKPGCWMDHCSRMNPVFLHGVCPEKVKP